MDVKLDSCKTCGGIPIVVKYSFSHLIKCKCGMQTKTCSSLERATEIWNGYKEPDLRELLIDLIKELKSARQDNKEPQAASPNK